MRMRIEFDNDTDSSPESPHEVVEIKTDQAGSPDEWAVAVLNLLHASFFRSDIILLAAMLKVGLPVFSHHSTWFRENREGLEVFRDQLSTQLEHLKSSVSQ